MFKQSNYQIFGYWNLKCNDFWHKEHHSRSKKTGWAFDLYEKHEKQSFGIELQGD
mgnify:CR=1 FL=1